MCCGGGMCLSTGRDWFVQTSHDILGPVLMKHPGIIRAELYHATTGDHFVSAIWWENNESRCAATAAMLMEFPQIYTEIIPCERNAPEILTLTEGTISGAGVTP